MVLTTQSNSGFGGPVPPLAAARYFWVEPLPPAKNPPETPPPPQKLPVMEMAIPIYLPNPTSQTHPFFPPPGRVERVGVPSQVSDNSDVRGEEWRTPEPTDLIFPKWQSELFRTITEEENLRSDRDDRVRRTAYGTRNSSRVSYEIERF